MHAPLKGHGLGAGRPGLESSSRRQLCALDRLPLPRRLTLLLCKPEVSSSPLEGAWDVWQVLGVSLLSGWPGPVTGNYPRATQTPCCQEETGVFFPSPHDTCSLWAPVLRCVQLLSAPPGAGAAFGHHRLYFSESGDLLEEDFQTPRPWLTL